MEEHSRQKKIFKYKSTKEGVYLVGLKNSKEVSVSRESTRGTLDKSK